MQFIELNNQIDGALQSIQTIKDNRDEHKIILCDKDIVYLKKKLKSHILYLYNKQKEKGILNA